MGLFCFRSAVCPFIGNQARPGCRAGMYASPVDHHPATVIRCLPSTKMDQVVALPECARDDPLVDEHQPAHNPIQRVSTATARLAPADSLLTGAQAHGGSVYSGAVRPPIRPRLLFHDGIGGLAAFAPTNRETDELDQRGHHHGDGHCR